MEKAIAYCRVSDPRQVKDEGSLDRQELEAREHSKRKGYDLIRVFVEAGQSAKTDDRTELKKLLAYVKAHSVQVLVVPKIDRLARNSFDYLSLKLLLHKCGTRIESVGENIEDTPVGRFLETVLSGTAQLDNEIRAERSRNGMVDAFKQGRWMWRPPYGYESRNGILVPKEPEATMVRTIFKLLNTLTPTQCLEEVQKRGFPLTSNGFFKLISNPLYTGRMRSFGIEVVGAFEPLAKESDLYRQKPQRNHLRYNPEFPLKTLCTCCGRLTGSWSRGRSTLYPYYRCKQCGVSYPRSKVEEGFAEFLNSSGLSDRHFGLLVDTLNRTFQNQKVDRDHSRREIERQLARNRELQGSLAMKSAAGTIPDDIASEQIQLLREKEFALRTTLPPEEISIPELLDFSERILRKPGDHWYDSEHLTKLRFQQFVFPEGAYFDNNLRFGTKKMRLLEPANRLISPHQCALVDPDLDVLNQLLVDLSDFRNDFSGGKEY